MQQVLEQIDRAILAGLYGAPTLGGVRLDSQWWGQWDLPVWAGGVPQFTGSLEWAEILRVSLGRIGYLVTLKSCNQAIRYRVSGPTAGAGHGCKTIWLDQWDGPAPGPVALGLATYHRLYGAEMLGYVENLLVAA